MSYYVIGQDGSKYGPADLDLIIQWINEGRIASNTTIEDSATGQRSRAIDMPAINTYVASAPKTTPPPTMPSQPVYTPPSYPGYPRANDQGMYASRQPIQIDSHLTKSIIVTLCCCQIMGIIAIVFSVMAQSKASSGDPSAVKDAETADTIGNWAIGLGLVGGILYALLMFGAGAMR